jgi:hypothetical protein
MSQRLKRWESPRKEGRNSKGKGGSARHRQLKKQQQMLRKRLKDNSQPNDSSGKRSKILFPLFLSRFRDGDEKIANRR